VNTILEERKAKLKKDKTMIGKVYCLACDQVAPGGITGATPFIVPPPYLPRGSRFGTSSYTVGRGRLSRATHPVNTRSVQDVNRFRHVSGQNGGTYTSSLSDTAVPQHRRQSEANSREYNRVRVLASTSYLGQRPHINISRR
jgi:hypothetical protein